MSEATMYICNKIGVAGTTKCHVRKDENGYVARMGIAIMGCTNMDPAILINSNPFDEQFHDNYVEGTGETGEEDYKKYAIKK